MRSDLERLLITEAELLELTGYDRHQFRQLAQIRRSHTQLARAIALGIGVIGFVTFASIFVPPLRVSAVIFGVSLSLGILGMAIEFAEVAFLFLTITIIAALYSLYTFTTVSTSVILLCLALAIALAIATLFLASWLLRHRHHAQSSALKKEIPKVIWRLFDEVDKCNRVIKHIDVFDQLQDAGNPIKLESREAAIAALRMTRNDLIRALKTERILRENPQFQPDRFDIDITAFAAWQIGDRAQEYAKVFDTTLQIAIDVQKAMQDLQAESSKK